MDFLILIPGVAPKLVKLAWSYPRLMALIPSGYSEAKKQRRIVSMRPFHFGLREIFYVVTIASVVMYVVGLDGAEILLPLAILSAGLLIAVLRGNARMRQKERSDLERPE